MSSISETEEIGMTSRTGQGRQERATKACEECRRRKLRCDGQEPQCGVCRDAGATCEFNAGRALRGPKKGYFKELKDRVGWYMIFKSFPILECWRVRFGASTNYVICCSNIGASAFFTAASWIDYRRLRLTYFTPRSPRRASFFWTHKSSVYGRK